MSMFDVSSTLRGTLLRGLLCENDDRFGLVHLNANAEGKVNWECE